MDILLAILSLIATAVIILFIACVIYEILDRRRRKRYNQAKRLALKRKCLRELEMYEIGIRIKNTLRPKNEKRIPIRKVYGDFAHMADLWEYEGKGE